MGMSEKVLCLHAQGNGPWVRAHRVRMLVLHNASEKDLVRVNFRDHKLTTNPTPVLLRGSTESDKVEKAINYPTGELMVERIAGDNCVTVLALCESHNVTETNARHHLRRVNSAPDE